MGKKTAPRDLANTEAKAFNSSIRTSPQKLNLVAQSIRGLNAGAALAQLTFSKRRVAVEVKKVLQSAIANAENNNGADVDELKVSEIYVDEGPTMKRIRPRAKGRADRILKRTSHITVKVSDGRSGGKE